MVIKGGCVSRPFQNNQKVYILDIHELNSQGHASQNGQKYTIAKVKISTPDYIDVSMIVKDSPGWSINLLQL